jgi:hypothetical protein
VHPPPQRSAKEHLCKPCGFACGKGLRLLHPAVRGALWRLHYGRLQRRVLEEEAASSSALRPQPREERAVRLTLERLSNFTFAPTAVDGQRLGASHSQHALTAVRL